MKDSVVITGATGFIGQHLARYFSQKGVRVYALVPPGRSKGVTFHNDPNILIREFDMHDIQLSAESCSKNPLAVIHLAWEGVASELRSKTRLQFSNVELSLSAVELAAELDAQRIVLLGSTLEYAFCEQVVNRKAPPSPLNAYGAAKIASRFLSESLAKELKVPFVYSVLTGVYAPDRLGNNVINYVIRELLSKRKPSLTRMEQMWDYVHIDDAIRAIYLIMTKGKDGAFYAIGSGESKPLAEYVQCIRDIIDPSLPLGVGDLPYPQGPMISSCVDLSELSRDTGYCPQIPFSKGIVSVINAIKNEQNEVAK